VSGIERGKQAAYDIKEDLTEQAGGTLNVRQCDLASLDSVAEFATGVQEDYGELHILCNNAGVMAIPEAKPKTASKCNSVSITSATLH